MLTRTPPDRGGAPAPRTGGWDGVARMAALGGLAALCGLAGALGTWLWPAVAWVPLSLVVGGWGSDAGPRLRASLVGVALAGLTTLAWVGADWPQGRLRTGPISGVHPMQHVALIVDGHGPHDLVVPGHVDPDGTRGLSPAQLAAAFEAQMHAVGALAYADGSPGADAWGKARVWSEATRRDDGGPSARLIFQSGGRGRGATVRGVCPSLADPTRALDDPRRCPDRHAYPGDAGLGMRARFGAVARDGRGPKIGGGGPVLAVVAGLLAAGGVMAVAGRRVGRQRHRRRVVVATGLAISLAAGAAAVNWAAPGSAVFVAAQSLARLLSTSAGPVGAAVAISLFSAMAMLVGGNAFNAWLGPEPGTDADTAHGDPGEPRARAHA